MHDSNSPVLPFTIGLADVCVTHHTPDNIYACGIHYSQKIRSPLSFVLNI